MPRIRTVKPGFFRSEDVSPLPFRARLTWIGLWTQCDDHGRYKDSARLIKADVWPLDPDVSLRDVEDDLNTLADLGRIVRYQVDGKPYLAVVNWHAHQSINRPTRPQHPAPPVPLGSLNPEDPNHCAVCAVPGPGPAPTDRLAPAGTAPEPRETTGTHDPLTEPHSGLTEPSVKPHEALTLGKERKGKEGTRAPARESPPPARCPPHINTPDPGPCGPCADARRTRQRWDRDRAATASAEQSTRATATADANRAAIANCQLCDDHGARPGTPIPCNHDPAADDRLHAGLAAARAAAPPRPRPPLRAVPDTA